MLPAVYENRSRLFDVLSSEMSSESQDLSGIFRHAVIRPGSKMVMFHFALFATLSCLKKLVKDVVQSLA
jgi:hypothetical protein